MYTHDGRARCPRCDVPLNDERRPADFTTPDQGINLCPACESNEAEKRASYEPKSAIGSDGCASMVR